MNTFINCQIDKEDFYYSEICHCYFCNCLVRSDNVILYPFPNNAKTLYDVFFKEEDKVTFDTETTN